MEEGEVVSNTPENNEVDDSNLPTHDHNGKPFVRNSKGKLAFGEIPQSIADKIKRQPAPIMLSEGNENYGLQHIDKRRGDDIKKFGYNSVEELVEDVAQNYNEIRKDDNGKLIIAKRNGKDKMAVIKLSPTANGDVYSITTSAIVDKRTIDKKGLLWSAENSQDATTTSLHFQPTNKQGGNDSKFSVRDSNSQDKDTKNTETEKGQRTIIFNGKEYYRRKDGTFTTKHKDGKIGKVTKKARIQELEEIYQKNKDNDKKSVRKFNKLNSHPSSVKVRTGKDLDNTLNWRETFNALNNEIGKISMLSQATHKNNFTPQEYSDMLDVMEQMSDDFTEKWRVYNNIALKENAPKDIKNRAKELEDAYWKRLEARNREDKQENVRSQSQVESETPTSSEKVSPNTPKGKQGNRQSGNTLQTNSERKDKKKTPKGKDTGIERRKLSDLNTDESRFQGRKKLNETIVNNIANNFSDKDQDPIHIWTDPKDGKAYVLSGHHRYYGAKRAGRRDVKVIDRTNDFTEAEAIRFAKEEANANRSMETPLERASTLRQKRERGEDTKAFLENEGRNKNVVNNLSYLNPKGKTVQSMQSFETTNESDSKRETERIADWTGEVMRVFKDYLTPAHENEIYDFLNNKEKSKRFTNKREFVEKVRLLIGLDFDPSQPLNLARVSTKGSQEQEWENEANQLKDKIADYEKQITDLDNRFTDPKREDYISPETKNFQELKDIAREEKARLKAEQKAVYDKLDKHNSKKRDYQKADASIGNIFEGVDFQRNKNAPYKKGKITNKAFGKLIEKLQKHFGKAFKKGVNITTDWNEFKARAEAYSRREANKRVNEEFNKELNALKGKGKDYPKHFLSLGLPSNILKSIGVPNLNITIGKNTLLNSSQKK